MKLFNKLFITKLFLFIFLEINNNFYHLKAEKYEIFLKGSNIDLILRLLKKADRRNAPKIVINPDRSKSIIYKKSNFQKELSQKELLYLIKYPKSFYKEQKFVKDTLKFLNELGVSVLLGEINQNKGAAFWSPEKQIIKIDSKTINSGTLIFAKILNHEMIHIAQSCKRGSINSFPELIGINEKMDKEKYSLLKSKVYKNLPKYQILLEKEAYSYQDNLIAGKYLINKFCN